MGCHFLLQGIFPTQGSNPGDLHCRQILYRLSHQGSPIIFLCLPMYIFAVNTSHFVSLLILHPTSPSCPAHLLTPSNTITLEVRFEHKDLGETRLVHKREENGCYVSLLRILLIHCSSSSLGVVQMCCAAWSSYCSLWPTFF